MPLPLAIPAIIAAVGAIASIGSSAGSAGASASAQKQLEERRDAENRRYAHESGIEFLESPKSTEKEIGKWDHIDWGERFGNKPNRLTREIAIDNKIAELEEYGKTQSEKWNNESRQNTYSGPMGMFAQPSQFASAAIPKEQKDWSAALAELRQARKNLDTYTEQDDKEDTAAGKERSGWSTMW